MNGGVGVLLCDQRILDLAQQVREAAGTLSPSCGAQASSSPGGRRLAEVSKRSGILSLPFHLVPNGMARWWWGHLSWGRGGELAFKEHSPSPQHSLPTVREEYLWEGGAPFLPGKAFNARSVLKVRNREQF